MDDALSIATNAAANEIRRNRTMVDFALLYADKGLRVLPLHTVHSFACSCGMADCHSPAKHPLTRNGVKDASYEAAQIREWWHLYPDANIGLATGRGLLVIDIDPKNGGSLEVLNALVALPPTATLRTGSGGLHLYFKYDRSLVIRNSAGKLAPGIDVRGENGYVVAPPSMHISGNRYRWDKHDGYVPAPEALLQLVRENAPPSPRLAQVNTALDLAPTHENTTSSPALVQSSSSQFIPEGKRNSTLVSLAGSLRNQGANEEALFITLQALNKGCCQPPLTEYEVRQICKSAGNWTPGVSGKVPSRGAMLVSQVSALMSEDLSSPPWAIPGLLPEGVSLLAGKPKMGKSWLALGLAISIAQGHNALGKLPTNQGTVLYLGLEDNKQRICSRVSKLLVGATPPDALFWTGSCFPLTMGGLTDLEAWIMAASQPRLIVIDTLARVRAANGNSNGNVYADDYAAITPLKTLAEQYHLSILLIHHLRKSGASDPMDEISGSTGLTGATDCNMVLQRERGQNKAALHITGRDVEDQVLKLSFDIATGLWSISNTPADERPLSSVRASIISLLTQKDQPLSPMEIATTLGLDTDIVRKKLSLMKQAGQIGSAARGLYQLKASTLDIDDPL